MKNWIEVKSPVTGRVMVVNAAVSAVVDVIVGQVILTIESIKMQHQVVNNDASGALLLHVDEGVMVMAGDVLGYLIPNKGFNSPF